MSSSINNTSVSDPILPHNSNFNLSNLIRFLIATPLLLHSIIYLLYFILDVVYLFEISYSERNFIVGFYSNILWTGFNMLNFVLVTTCLISIYSGGFKSNSTNKRDYSFIRNIMFIGIPYLIFIDSIGLALDIAIYVEAKDIGYTSTKLTFRYYEFITDFILLALDLLMWIIYIRYLYKGE